MKTNNRVSSESIAIVIAAIIAGLVAFSLFFLEKKDDTPVTAPKEEQVSCDHIKEQAEEKADKINRKILTLSDDRELINHMFWRDKFKEISLYDCSYVRIKKEKIESSFFKSKKQIGI